MTDPAFIIYFGEQYEATVKELSRRDEPIIQINNLNGCTSSIPIDRAKHLLEKYYKMAGKTATKKEQETIPIDTYNMDIKLRVNSQSPMKKVVNFATSE